MDSGGGRLSTVAGSPSVFETRMAEHNHKPNAATILVECLGPRSFRKRHWFKSPSKFIRICPDCVELQRNTFVMPEMHVHDGHYFHEEPP